MRDSSSEHRRPASTEVALPLLRRRVEVAIGHPRQLSAPEWILVEILGELGKDAPPVAVCARELGLPDSSLLEEALESLLREGVLRREGAGKGGSWELAGHDFTDLGRVFLRKGEVPGRPVWHQLEVDVDPVMGTIVRRIQEPRSGTPRADLARVTEVLQDVPRPAPGLAEVRKWVRKEARHLIERDGRAVDVRWAEEDSPVGTGVKPAFGWARCLVGMERDPLSGELKVQVKGHGKAARVALVEQLYPEVIAELKERATFDEGGHGSEQGEHEEDV